MEEKDREGTEGSRVSVREKEGGREEVKVEQRQYSLRETDKRLKRQLWARDIPINGEIYCIYIHIVYVHVLMRDEKEERSKESHNKQQGKATQHTQGSHLS